ncbi:uncharacterized protein TM35_000401050 [Trypanosoma theileri]|uniref:Uncharacterized protein n=1 Tax=Trypanosoma theileri TaxID=67003 RepID=A0A1X0NK04_9TRYP|nr:uncharacterized protein TM35_000401050 [Trypanosoma theileri]ORC84838.1 hypothetical protein TM35_000401050 [Trypanosoma theileri]
MSHAGPSPAADTELSLRTIAEQQRIIEAMRQIIAELKARVATLEAAARSPPTATKSPTTNPTATSTTTASTASTTTSTTITTNNNNDTTSAATAAAAAAAAEVARLTRERDAAAAGLAETRAECRRLDAAATSTRSLLHAAAARARVAEDECRRLREFHENIGVERARWKALATAIAARLDDDTRTRALLHIEALDRNGRTRGEIAVPSDPLDLLSAVSVLHGPPPHLPRRGDTSTYKTYNTYDGTSMRGQEMRRGGGGRKGHGRFLVPL